LGGLGESPLAQQIDGLFHLAAGFLQRRLAVHHACAGAFAQLLHHLRRDVGHGCDFPMFVPAGLVAMSGTSRGELARAKVRWRPTYFVERGRAMDAQPNRPDDGATLRSTLSTA